jgi:hypothetical protein
MPTQLIDNAANDPFGALGFRRARVTRRQARAAGTNRWHMRLPQYGLNAAENLKRRIPAVPGGPKNPSATP